MLAPLQHSEHMSWGAVYIRLTRNYGYMLAAVYIGWIVKLTGLESGVPVGIFLVVTVLLIAVAIVVFILRPADGGAWWPFLFERCCLHSEIGVTLFRVPAIFDYSALTKGGHWCVLPALRDPREPSRPCGKLMSAPQLSVATQVPSLRQSLSRPHFMHVF